jgi:hypothetical protein
VQTHSHITHKGIIKGMDMISQNSQKTLDLAHSGVHF